MWSGLYSITDNWVTLGQCSPLSLAFPRESSELAELGLGAHRRWESSANTASSIEMRARMRDSVRMRGSRSGRQEGGQGGLPGVWPTSFFSPRNWSLTASGQQRRGLRPGAPEAAEARLCHARSNCEGVARPAPQVAQYTLSAPFQDLHLGFGGARRDFTN